ncbi:hypothetical protein KEJ21_06215 [Candidatus Bathyarchaeota archaeon]|nr:hypothetical protein [Candidatus Bathyarchaeota archaeon]MBS7631512.1 hypothetical protein [Candidatus Bathyarchaeota archaeon]
MKGRNATVLLIGQNGKSWVGGKKPTSWHRRRTYYYSSKRRVRRLLILLQLNEYHTLLEGICLETIQKMCWGQLAGKPLPEP